MKKLILFFVLVLVATDVPAQKRVAIHLDSGEMILMDSLLCHCPEAKFIGWSHDSLIARIEIKINGNKRNLLFREGRPKVYPDSLSDFIHFRPW